MINPLSNNKMLDLSKLKAFVDNKDVTQKSDFCMVGYKMLWKT